jgi:hypothetical protein
VKEEEKVEKAEKESRVFDSRVFGTELAELLDGLQRVQDADAVASSRMFTRPTGQSWYEADALTFHFNHQRHDNDNADLAAVLAPSQAHPGGLTTHDVCAMLRERWLTRFE